MKKANLSAYILFLDVLHTAILIFSYFWGIYAFITGNFYIQILHFVHVVVLSAMVLRFWSCILTDHTNAMVKQNGQSRDQFSDFTQHVFFLLCGKKFPTAILLKLNKGAVVLW